MSKYHILLAGLGSLALAACSQASDRNGSSAELADSAAVSEVARSPAATDDGLGLPAIPANVPKLAYSYGMNFALPSADIGRLMRRHADLCEQQGPASCRIVGMDLSGSAERDDVRGMLQLAVAANHARAVSALLEDEADGMGASQTATTIGSEEVSKTIIDTEARIRAREQLRDRLMAVLRTRKGKVSELVEAERQVAAVNEEIDQARSWLAETKGRVAFSTMEIGYSPKVAVSSDFMAPVAGALGSLGGILGTALAALIVILAIALPVLGTVLSGRWVVRRLRAAGIAAT